MEENKGILLESGTNEFEIVEFTVGAATYGINVAKVREVINPLPVTTVANSHPFLDGVFSLRGRVIPQVNLPKALGLASASEKYNVVVCEINGTFIAFRVDGVHRIHRISWREIEPPPTAVNSTAVTGIVKMAERLVLLLDFERIMAEIDPEIARKLSALPENSAEYITARHDKTILVAEDSKVLRELLLDTLHTAGYKTIENANGQEAWDKLAAIAGNGSAVTDQVQLIITDIEMPQMDGHHLTKCIKTDESLKILPVVIFSSLISEEMHRKGEALGAAAQVTKPAIAQLISIVDKLILAS